MDAVRADDELAEQARTERAEARRNLESAVRRAYRHFIYLAEGDQENEPRVDRTHPLEPDSNLTSLDGTAVWKALVGQGKAFDVSALTAKALLHDLDVKDYGRPLDELRDLFWSTPRLPLLPGGEPDLQKAIYDAVSAGQLRLVGAAGEDRAVTRPGDIAVGSAGLRLAPPKSTDDDGTTTTTTSGAATGGPAGGASTSTSGGASGAGTGAVTGGTTSGVSGGAVTYATSEREITFSLMTSMSDSDTRDAVRRLLLALSNAADEELLSWAQLQVMVVVVDTSVADSIEQAVRDSGTNPSSRSV